MKKMIRRNRIIIEAVIVLVLTLVLGLQAGYLWQRSIDGGSKEVPEQKNESGRVEEDPTQEESTSEIKLTDEEGLPLSGVVRRDGTLRYYEDGLLCQQEGWILQDGEKYYVNSDGSVRISSLFRADDAAYYVDTAGRMVHGFFRVDDRLRYFDAEGKLKEEEGWLELDGKWYYVDDTAGIVTAKDCPAEEESEDAPYIYGADSSAMGEKIGRYTVKGKDYLFDPDGVLLMGKVPVDAYSFFYTDGDGAVMKDQDFELDGLTCHAGPDGRVYTGTMSGKAVSYGSYTDYLILCNLDTQRTAVFEGEKGNWRLLREMLVSTGAPINPTPKGEYSTTVHTEHFNNYGVRAWYATGFIGGLYLFHSSPYEIDSEPKVCTDDRLGIPASHGCVRMRLEDAKWMYDLLPLETKVVIYEEDD